MSSIAGMVCGRGIYPKRASARRAPTSVLALTDMRLDGPALVGIGIPGSAFTRFFQQTASTGGPSVGASTPHLRFTIRRTAFTTAILTHSVNFIILTGMDFRLREECADNHVLWRSHPTLDSPANSTKTALASW